MKFESKMNLHIHSLFSDGFYSIDNIIESARNYNVDLIGITDHYATHKLSKTYQVTDLNNYIHVLTKYKQEIHNIRVLLGLELDCGKMGWDINYWEFKYLNKLDYILLEYIQDPYWGGKKLKKVIEYIEDRINIPIGLAHSHLMKNFNLNSTEKCIELCKYLQKKDIFIELNEGELNANSIDGKYYFEFFSEDLISAFLDFDIAFSIGTDSHQQYILNKTEKAHRFIKDKDLRLLRI